jgi:hypothetical protein
VFCWPWFKGDRSGYRMPCKPPMRRRSRRSSTPTGQAVTCHPGGRSVPPRSPKARSLGTSLAAASAAVVLGRVQRSRRNVVAAIGVRLSEAPGAPSRGAVHIRIPSGQRNGRRQRVALGDTHLSGDPQSLLTPSSRSGWMARSVIAQLRTVDSRTVGLRAATGTAECMTTRPDRSGRRRQREPYGRNF